MLVQSACVAIGSGGGMSSRGCVPECGNLCGKAGRRRRSPDTSWNQKLCSLGLEQVCVLRKRTLQFNTYVSCTSSATSAEKLTHAHSRTAVAVAGAAKAAGRSRTTAVVRDLMCIRRTPRSKHGFTTSANPTMRRRAREKRVGARCLMLMLSGREGANRPSPPHAVCCTFVHLGVRVLADVVALNVRVHLAEKLRSNLAIEYKPIGDGHGNEKISWRGRGGKPMERTGGMEEAISHVHSSLVCFSKSGGTAYSPPSATNTDVSSFALPVGAVDANEACTPTNKHNESRTPVVSSPSLWGGRCARGRRKSCCPGPAAAHPPRQGW